MFNLLKKHIYMIILTKIIFLQNLQYLYAILWDHLTQKPQGFKSFYQMCVESLVKVAKM